MMVLGITGGVGSGKSRILEILNKEYGAEVIQADAIAKELEEPGAPGLVQLVAQFGPEILDADGRLERALFAERIFQDETALLQVNAIIHPLTWQTIRERVADSDARLVAVEAALFDARSREICQKLVYVDVPEETRIRRLMEHRGYSREKCLDIMQNQPSRAEFLALADFVIDNGGGIDTTRQQIADMMQVIGGQAAAIE